jgi:hypothetical protein
MGQMNKPTKELKVAEKMSEMVNDLTLDLDQVGVFLASNNNVTYRRLLEVIDSAEYVRNEGDKNNDDYTY